MHFPELAARGRNRYVCDYAMGDGRLCGLPASHSVDYGDDEAEQADNVNPITGRFPTYVCPDHKAVMEVGEEGREGEVGGAKLQKFWAVVVGSPMNKNGLIMRGAFLSEGEACSRAKRIARRSAGATCYVTVATTAYRIPIMSAIVEEKLDEFPEK